MSGENQNKVMTTHEAIRRFVSDGDHLVIGNYTGMPSTGADTAGMQARRR